jgi:hypothetical protein
MSPVEGNVTSRAPETDRPPPVPAAETPPNRAQRRTARPKRRQWLDRVAEDRRLTAGSKSWLLLLARRSDDAGKPVWGRQTRQAEDLGRGDRSVRRYRAEAEELGYVKCYRARPERDAHGRWCRRRTNTYYLCLPGRETAVQEAPRRRQRAGYCVLKDHKRPAAGHPGVLPDSDGRSTPSGVRKPPPPPPREHSTPPPPPENPKPGSPRSPLVEDAIAAARKSLPASAPRGLQPRRANP